MKWKNVYDLCAEDCVIVNHVIGTLSGSPSDNSVEEDIAEHIDIACDEIGCEPNDPQAVEQTLLDLFE